MIAVLIADKPICPVGQVAKVVKVEAGRSLGGNGGEWIDYTWVPKGFT